jgi:hypothetical protein
MKTLARDRDKAEILRRLATLTPASERRWGKMTVHQMVCHLADGFRMTSGERPVRDVAVRLEAFLEQARAGRCRPHPIFGRLSPAAWLRWGYLHCDHHLRQFGA